jgi:hypothetical protein
MTTCIQCGVAFGSGRDEGCAAAISGGIAGDEYTESYFLCERCGVYTVEVRHEPFLGEECSGLKGPLPKAKGDDAVALIQRCPEPWNKKCRCEAHQTYFEGQLD